MWALRAAVRRALRQSRPGRGCTTPGHPAPSRPARAFAAAAAGHGGPGDQDGLGGRDRGRARGWGGRAGEDEEEEQQEQEEGQEQLLQREPLLPVGAQRVCVVHPEIKWGPSRPPLTRGDSAPPEGTGTRGGGAGGSEGRSKGRYSVSQA